MRIFFEGYSEKEKIFYCAYALQAHAHALPLDAHALMLSHTLSSHAPLLGSTITLQAHIYALTLTHSDVMLRRGQFLNQTPCHLALDGVLKITTDHVSVTNRLLETTLTKLNLLRWLRHLASRRTHYESEHATKRGRNPSK